MIIGNLKKQIAAYLQRPVSDFVVEGVDLLLAVINESHEYMQQQYDFKYAEVSVDALVSIANGLPISPLYLHGTNDYVTVKKVLRAFIADGYGGVRPIKYVSRDFIVKDAQQRWDGVPRVWAPTIRDMPNYPTFYEVYLSQVGQRLIIYPTSITILQTDPMPIFLDVIRYFPDYSSDDEDNVDFFLQFGATFMKYDSICRLNPRIKEFVPRQEGNVAAPTDERDKAWVDLLAWDANLVTTGDSSLSLS